MSIETNKQIARAFCDNISTGQIDAAMALMAEDSTWWVAGKPHLFALAGKKNKKEFFELLGQILAMMPKGLRLTPAAMTAEGDRVAVEAVSFGEMSNGKTYNNQYHLLFEIRDDKIWAVREYLDTMHVAEVMQG